MSKDHDAASSAVSGPSPSLVPAGDLARDLAGDLAGDLTRVRAARRLVTEAVNPAVDRLAELAARLLDTPAAQVSLLSDVQVISAAAGLDPATRAAATLLADSLCAVAAASGEALVVHDATTDARVAALTPVISGAVGAYLGVPLQGQDGQIVGALCVFGPNPRRWSATDVALLSDLAAAAVTELELTALAVDYEAARLRWQLAVAAGGVGTFDWDLLTGELTWDAALLAMFGYDDHDFGRSIDDFNARVHPEDLARVGAALQQAIEECGTFQAEYRVVRPGPGPRADIGTSTSTGTSTVAGTVWVRARGQALTDPTGRAVRLVGVAYDTTATRHDDARIARVLESMASAFFSLDRDFRFSYVNAEAERLLGHLRAELLGGSIWELFPEAVGSDFETHYRSVMDLGQAATFEAYYPAPLGAWYEVRAWPDPDGVSVYFLDITDRRRSQRELELARREAETAREEAETAREEAEAARREAEAQRQATARALQRTETAYAQTAAAAERLRMVVRVSEDLSSTLDVQEAVARLAQQLVPDLADWCLVTLVDEGAVPRAGREALRDVSCHHAEPALRDAVRAYRDARLTALSPQSYLYRVWHTARPVTIASAVTEAITDLLSADSPARELLQQLAPAALECLPMRARGRTIGLITLFHDREENRLGPEDLLLATDIADRAGLALDNARLYSAQHRMAEGLQRSLLTAPVEPDHVQVVVRYQPAARAAQVGGDWYDAFITPDGSTMLVIGDVMGHDIAAAAGMSQVRSLLRGIAYATGASPAGILSGLDAAMQGLAVETTATAVVARLEQSEDERSRDITRLRWSNAGHPSPLLLTPDGTVTPLAVLPPQLLLGIDPSSRRDDAAITVDRGSTVLLYTDGLIERRDRSMDEGLQALREAVADLAGESLDDLVDGVLARLVPPGHDDDVALVAVRLHREDEPRPAEAGPVRLPEAMPPVLQ